MGAWCKILVMKTPTKKPQEMHPLRLLVTGFAMGSADIVPGVSGGTIALIMGVYEQLIDSIKTSSTDAVKLVLSGKIREGVLTVPWRFLVPLGVGILGAIATLARIIEWLLANQPVYLWSFFFGLVLASVYVVGKKVGTWGVNRAVVAVVAAILTFLVVGAVPVETPNNLPAMFISGAIAICAMILPGISGSFLLVIMGKYSQVLGAVTDRDIVTLVVFACGAVVGLAMFSRLLSWLFANYHDVTMAALTGVMVGSLRKVWPWKEVLVTRVDSHGEIVPVVDRNVLPGMFDDTVMIALMLSFVAVLLIVYLNHVDETKS